MAIEARVSGHTAAQMALNLGMTTTPTGQTKPVDCWLTDGKPCWMGSKETRPGFTRPSPSSAPWLDQVKPVSVCYCA